MNIIIYTQSKTPPPSNYRKWCSSNVLILQSDWYCIHGWSREKNVYWLDSRTPSLPPLPACAKVWLC